MIHEVTARLRPRTGWESQDLGLAMVRNLLPRLMSQWLCVMLPLWAVLAAVLWRYPAWLLFAVWWLKPVYDRVPLHTLGRKLFGQETSLRELLRAAPTLLLRGNLYFLTIGRLAPHRAIAMPVKFLEGGTLSAYRRRVRTLLLQGDSTITWVTLGWLGISILCAVGLNMLLHSVVIDTTENDSRNWLLELFTSRRSTPWTPATLRFAAFLYMVSVTLTEMFYVGAGFGMYLNSRSHLEGWDIEVTFRSLATRLQQQFKVGLMVGALMLYGLNFSNAHAALELDPETTEERLTEIMAQPEFVIHSEQYTVYDDVTSPKPSNSDSSWDWSWLNGLGWVTDALAILLVVAFLALIVWLIYRYGHHFVGTRETSKPTVPESARTVMGLEVSPEALPADIPSSAWAFWQQGNIHAAMRLLYAGSLNWMMHRGGLPIRESDTEGDCLRHAAQLPDAGQTSYFQFLTRTWMSHTYGDTQPASGEMELLVQQWPFKK